MCCFLQSKISGARVGRIHTPHGTIDTHGFFFWLLCFFLQSKISGARVGRIHTPHGTIDTPGYVPVATIAAQKAVDHRLMDEVLCR